MKRKLNILPGDKPLWVIFFLLSVISLISVYTTVGLSAISEHGTSPTFEFLKHLGFVCLSYVTVYVAARMNYRWFSILSMVLLVISFGLLIYVYITGGERWVRVCGFGFQPSELAKVSVIIWLASKIAKLHDEVNLANFFRLLIVPAIVCISIVGANFSTAVLIGISCFVMMFFGGVNDKLWYKLCPIVLLLGVILLAAFYYFGGDADVARTSTWQHRLQSWVNPNPDEISQENMARMAVARGGFTGVGIGNTIHGRLMTEAHNDFIYAIIIEETGMLGAFVVFALYAVFYFRCIRIASRCKGAFGALSVAGLGTMIFLQALSNMCVAVGAMPVTGQTLPFISYGGSAYLFLGFGLGVIQAVAHDNNKKALEMQKAAETSTMEQTELNNQNIETI